MLRKKLKLSKSVIGDVDPNVHGDGSADERGVGYYGPVSVSPYFEIPFWKRMYQIECRLSAELSLINFKDAKVAAVYNPIEYASEIHCAFLEKYLHGPKTVLFIGMNPGPWGMCQTGVIILLNCSNEAITVIQRRIRVHS